MRTEASYYGMQRALYQYHNIADQVSHTKSLNGDAEYSTNGQNQQTTVVNAQ